MSKRPIHPARRVFRRFLLVMLTFSMGFMAMMVTLRVQYRGDKPIEGAMQLRVFQFDVLQHQAWALVSNDAQDMVIAEQLLGHSIFSPLYTQAGLDMLRAKADAGYIPAITRLDEIYPNGAPSPLPK